MNRMEAEQAQSHLTGYVFTDCESLDMGLMDELWGLDRVIDLPSHCGMSLFLNDRLTSTHAAP